MNKRILCTTQSGGVAVVVPADECVRALETGGYVSQVYWGRVGLRKFVLDTHKDKIAELLPWISRGVMPMWLAREWEIHKFTSDPGWRPDRLDRDAIAARWIDALIEGGCTADEALRLIADKDAPAFSHAVEIVDVSAIPVDRTRRADWRRSTNGGPIYIAGQG